MRVPLFIDDAYLLLAPRFGAATTVVLLALPLVLVAYLYRQELGLISRKAAVALFGLRLLVLLVLWFVVALQPTVARFHREDVPSRVLVAVDRSRSMEVRDVQRGAQEKTDLAKALRLDASATDRIDALSRSDIARHVLGVSGNDWLGRLAKNHQVRLIGFDKTSWEAKSAEELFAKAADQDVGQATDLRVPLARALEPASADQGKLLGVVLFTDGQHNAGPSPLGKAKELGDYRVPVFPVLIGAKEPPADIAVLEVKAPPSAFKDADIQVEARVKISGVAAGLVEVELTQNGKPTDQRVTIRHDGLDRVAPVRFDLRLNEIGSHTLEVKAQGGKDVHEVSQENNASATVVRVAEDKARVLLVDGEARWEQHYIASALSRDATVKLDQVVFSQPRVGELPEEKLAEIGHARVAMPKLKPGEDDPLDIYDCILLGDVPPDKLDADDRRRLERYVGQRGGTLVLLAGKRYLPMGYLAAASAATDPLAKMLPVTEAQPIQPEAGFNLGLTPDGQLAPFLQLDAPQDANRKRFAEFPRHFWGLVGKAKPGATVLAVPEDAKATVSKAGTDRGVFVQQNYGFGRVLFLGVDSTWRWRYRVGDQHHHRFWGQVVRWAAADKLLPGGNRYVRFGSREPVVRHGQAADIAVRLAEDTPALKPGAAMQVRLWRQKPDGKEEQAALVPLTRNAKLGKLLEAQVRDLAAGQYRLEVDIPDLKKELAEPPGPEEAKNPRRDWFSVLPPEDGEMFDLATNEGLLRSIAETSGGRLFTPENVDVLLDLFARQVVSKERSDEERIWQDAPLVWWTLALLLTLLSAEWIIRKWAGLP